MRPQCANETKLQHWDMAEPPVLKGTLEFHQPAKAASANIASFTQEFSLLPAHFSTMVFRERLETPTAANMLLAASRRTLTKLTLGHNGEPYSPHPRAVTPTVYHPILPFSAIPEGINLKSLDALKELELSTLFVQALPSVLRSIRSKHLRSIRFVLLIHQFEDDVDYLTRQLWRKLDFELCALADRIQAANTHSSGELRVRFVDLDPTAPVWMVEEIARVYLPRSKEHGYIEQSFSVG